MLATARPSLEEAHPELLASVGAVRLRLRGLEERDVAALAAAVLGAPLPDEAIAVLTERTGGNPLFVEQIVRVAREEGRDVAEVGAQPLPLDVEAAVQSRLDHLPPEEKELCKRAAIFDRPFAIEHLRGIGMHDPEPLLSSLVRRDLLLSRPRPRSQGGREYRFKSPVVRDVAYGMIADGLRRDLHLRVAMGLAAQPDVEPEVLAHHFERGGDLPRAARWLTAAAEAALGRGDLEAALRHAEAAIARGLAPEEQASLHLLRCEALDELVRLDDLDAAIDAALAAATTHTHRARALMHRAIGAFRRGASADAVIYAAHAVLSARYAADPETLALCRGREAVLLAYSGELAAAREAIAEAGALAAAHAPRLAPHVDTWRAQIAASAGDLRERRDAYAAAVEGYEAAGDLRRAAGAAMNLADVSNRVGAYAEAVRALLAAVERCHRVGSRLMEAYANANLGYSLLMQGHRSEAVAALDEAIPVADQLGDRRLARAARTYHARARLDARTALDVRDEAYVLAEQAAAEGDVEGEAHLRVLLARAALSLDELPLALAASERALALRDAHGGLEEDEAEVFLARAEVLERARRREEATQVRARGGARVEELAAAIADEELRGGFVHDVLAHRRLLGG